MPGVRTTPSEFAKLWESRLNAATDRIRVGVEKVSEAPGIKAAAQADKFRLKILEAIESGRWAGEVSRVTLADWKKAMLEKGIPRIRAGTAGAVPEMEEFGKELFTHIESGQREIEALPSVTLDDNIERMTRFIRHMSTFHWRAGK
jgi:hypothetical protein